VADDFAIPEVKQGRKAKDLVRYILGVGVGAVVLLLLFGKRGELTAAWHQVRQADVAWVLAAILAEATMTLTYSALQHRVLTLSGAAIRMGPLAALTMANDAIANTVPGEPVISSTYRYRYYRRHGVTAASAGWTIFTILVAQAVGMSLILLLGVLVALLASANAKALPITIAGLVIVLAAGAVLIRRDLVLRFLALLPRAAWRVSRDRHAGVRTVAARIESTLARMREIPLTARSTLAIVAIAAAFWFADCCCLVCSFAAVHAPVPWDGVLLAYGAAQVVGSLPIVPGGIGIIEGSLAVILIHYGSGRVSALSAVLVYRIVSFWLVNAIGWITVGVLARRRQRSTVT
jgi:putative heme transporter